MLKKIHYSLLAIILFCHLGYSQKEKLIGNKIVKTEQRELPDFHTIEINDNFPVVLEEGSSNIAVVEADGNFLEFIKTEVVDEVLTISAMNDFKRYKALEIRLYCASELRKIVINDEAVLKSLTPIKASDLHIESRSNEKMFLTVEAGTVQTYLHQKSDLKLHSKVGDAYFKINENASLEGIVTGDSLTVDLYQKGKIKLEGAVQYAFIHTNEDTDFEASKLPIKIAKVSAKGNSECNIFCQDSLDLTARDKSKIYLYGTPAIKITEFSDETILYKKTN